VAKEMKEVFFSGVASDWALQGGRKVAYANLGQVSKRVSEWCSGVFVEERGGCNAHYLLLYQLCRAFSSPQ
jgi:hypothetical protein